MTPQNSLAQLTQQGRLSPGFIFDEQSVEFVYLTAGSNATPAHVTSTNDASQLLSEANKHYCLEQINRLKIQFQRLPWYVRAYYGVLCYFMWCPLLPSAHRDQCRKTEQRLASLHAMQHTPISDFQTQCEAKWRPFPSEQVLTHTGVLPLGTTVYFSDTRQALHSGDIYYWTETVVAWLARPPLYRDDVDLHVTLYTDKGSLLEMTPEGSIVELQNQQRIFLSLEQLADFVAGRLTNLSYIPRTVSISSQSGMP